MREIKFRVWDSNKNRWNEDGTGYTKNSRVYAYDTEGIGINELIPFAQFYKYILCQYTGLKDKNGVEIYEGDVVKSSNPHIDNHEWAYWSIEWSADSYDYIGRFLKSGYGPNFTYGVVGLSAIEDDYRDIEVIGNIYENPELLDDGVKVDE